jgi:DNA-binding MurR/RpiR family transcriptional regulator
MNANWPLFFQREYPQLAFDNLTDIGAKAGVGKATVTQFVQRLGYLNFYEFSKMLREEVMHHMDTPLQRFTQMNQEAPATDPDHIFTRYLDSAIANLQRTRELHSGKNFSTAVDLLADTSRPLFLMGAVSAKRLISYFSLLLSYFRDNVVIINGNVSTIAHRITRLKPEAVLLTFSYDCYPKITGTTMRIFRQAVCQTILVTERRSSPLLRHTTVPIFVEAEGPGMFKSRCAGIAAMEALLAALTPRSSDKITRRLESMTRLFSEFDVYFH